MVLMKMTDVSGGVGRLLVLHMMNFLPHGGATIFTYSHQFSAIVVGRGQGELAPGIRIIIVTDGIGSFQELGGEVQGFTYLETVHPGTRSVFEETVVHQAVQFSVVEDTHMFDMNSGQGRHLLEIQNIVKVGGKNEG